MAKRERRSRGFKRNRNPVPNLWNLYAAARTLPMLAVRGEVSDVLDQSAFDRMAEVKPDLVRVVVPGVGHAPTLDEPIVRDALEGFLAGL